MIQIVLPDRGRWPSWLDSIQEFDGDILHGYSTFGYDELDLADPEVFEDWLAREEAQRLEAQHGFVPATVWWIVDDEEPEVVLGSIHLRHELNDWLLEEGGHIGYGVRPSARGRGVATAALLLALRKAAELGIGRVLLVCDADNPASRQTIVAAGGVLEDVRPGGERYWVELPGTEPRAHRA